jgi:hypothetical protein
MQYTMRSLFGFMTASALLVGFMGLPTDFKALLVLFAFAWASFGICFHHAVARKISGMLLAAVIIVWAATAVQLVLPELLTVWRK